jgi:hypothetical protein
MFNVECSVRFFIFIFKYHAFYQSTELFYSTKSPTGTLHERGNIIFSVQCLMFNVECSVRFFIIILKYHAFCQSTELFYATKSSTGIA